MHKISLLSLTLISAFTLNHRATAMEMIEQSIHQKLATFDTFIVKITKEFSAAEQQKNEDQKKYEACIAQQENEATKVWFYSPNYEAPEICAYKGKLTQVIMGCPNYSRDGSEGKHYALLKALKTNETLYTTFKDHLERGKRLEDQDYLKIIETNLQLHLEELNKK